jgi:[methyl-Co(III) methanol-specific corrinoid protein]:coenzyme M methyltransferase
MPFIEKMTSRERVMAALNGEPVDRPPLCNPTSIFTVEMMDLMDAPFPDACRDADLNARLAATGYLELGFDSTYHHATIIQESSALGCDVQWEQKDNWPTVRMGSPIWKSVEDIEIPPDFLDHPDVKCILDSTEILKRELGDECAIVGKTMGPWTLGYHTFGVENWLLMSIDDPDMTRRALDELKEVSALHGQAQIEAGADALTFPDHATGDLVGPHYYRKFLLEIHQEMAERLNVPLILHICGRSVDRLNDIAQSNMAAFHFDSKNNPQEAMDIADGRIALVGNINNPQTIFAGTPDDVRAEVYACMDAGVDMIAPECAVPLSARIDNVLAIPQAVKDWCDEHYQEGAA